MTMLIAIFDSTSLTTRTHWPSVMRVDEFQRKDTHRLRNKGNPMRLDSQTRDKKKEV